MKRWSILSFALGLLAAAVLLGAALCVSAAGQRVTYEEEILQGSADAFRGVTMRQQARLGWSLRWETTARPGTGDAPDTIVHSSAWGESQPYEDPIRWNVWCALTNLPECRSMDEADELVRRVMQVAGAHTVTARAAEGYETFPLNFDFETAGVPDADIETRLQDLLRQTFQIPVPEDLTVDVTYGDYGDAFQNYLNFTVRCPAEPRLLTTKAAAIRTKDTLTYWFTLECRRADGSALDTSRIPGGTGVFQLDTAAGTLETVYPFPAETRIDDLWLTEDETQLCLLTERGGAHTLTVLSVPEMDVVQTLALPIAADVGVPYREAELLLLPAADETLTVLTHGADGTFTVRKTVHTGGDPALPPYTAAFDGVRLALAQPAAEDEDLTQDLDWVLSVYDEGGARSTMRCRCSLGQEIVPEWRRAGPENAKIIQPWWFDALRVELEAEP